MGANMNRYYQDQLSAVTRTSFSRSRLGKSVCYAILLIAVSSISWVPEGKCQACAQGREFDTTSGAYSKCFESIRRTECANRKDDSTCAGELACTKCKCKGAVFTNGNFHQLYARHCDWRIEGAKLRTALLARRCCGD
jgi:hypothetical protein